MPSTYTDSGIELIGDGEQSGTWGDTTNTNLQILDRMLSQAGSISLSNTTHTLTVSDGLLSDGQYSVLVFGGSPTGTNTVTIEPNDAQRVFIVKNASGESVILSQGSGTAVTVADGRSAIAYCDGAGSGAAVVDVSSAFVTSEISDIAALTPTDGNFIVGNGTTWVAESGNTALASLGVTATAAEINILDGATVTTAEINKLDGLTATTAELNKLDGFTGVAADLNYAEDLRATGVTATEFDYLDGVTGGIQSQLDGKVAGVTAGGGLTGGGSSGTVTLNHADTSTQSSVNNSGNTFIQDLTFDTYGHVTGASSATVSVNDATITVSTGGGLTGSGAFTTNQSSNETVTLSHADTSSQGNVNTSGTTVIDAVSVDTYGHVTSMATRDMASSIRTAVDSVKETISLGALSQGSNFETHSLGAAPSEVTWYLQCTTADVGFAVGDRIYQVSWQTDADNNEGFTVWANASNAGFGVVAGIEVVSPAGGYGTLNSTRWDVYVKVKA